MKKNITLLLIIISVLYSHPTVSNLDLEQFMGRWYVIGLIPNWIEENCTNSYDDYKLNKDGTIDINYHAIKNGKKINIKQKGIEIDNKMPSKWEIKFTKPWIPFYKAPYEVIILRTNYEYMVVGYPDNSFGWIMARTTQMDTLLYNQILNKLSEDFGYEKNNFKKVIHN